jgi:hypothetical protein
MIAFLFNYPFTGITIQYGARSSNDLISRISRKLLKCLVDHKNGAISPNQHQTIIHGVDDLFPVAVDFFFIHIICPVLIAVDSTVLLKWQSLVSVGTV